MRTKIYIVPLIPQISQSILWTPSNILFERKYKAHEELSEQETVVWKNIQYTSLGQEEKDKGVKTEWQIVYGIIYIMNASNLSKHPVIGI